MKKDHSTNLENILLLLLSSIGVLLSIGTAGSIFILYLAMPMTGSQSSIAFGEWGMVSVGVIAVCGLPGIYWSVRRLRGSPPIMTKKPSPKWYWLVLILPASLGLGYLAFSQGVMPHLIGPMANILAALGTVGFALLLARSVSPSVSFRRLWGQFLTGLYAVPPFAIALELLALIPTIILLAISLWDSPIGEMFSESLLNPSGNSFNSSLELDPSLILQPGVLLIILAYAAVIVPIIEETLKTMAIWPLLSRRLSPGEAFLSGALAGAGYALFEALFLTQPGIDWVQVAFARGGATLIHTATAAISSWGLAEGFIHKRWNRLAIAYLFAIGIHGLWNASAILTAVLTLNGESLSDWLFPNAVNLLQFLTPLLLVTLSILAIAAILFFGRHLQKAETSA